jgi:hypothetical protein
VKTRIIALALTLVLATTSSTYASATVAPTEKPTTLNPTRIVSFRPYYGYSAQRVRVRLSHSEVDVITRMQKIADSWESPNPLLLNLIDWHIEPSVVGSPTVSIAIKAIHQARAFLTVPFNSGTKKIIIIIGRTQKYIQEQVAEFGCKPTLAISNGIYLMGATICNRNVIVMNLTGYLFLRSVTQPITSAMETRREPPMSSTSYLIAGRNLRSLAHEWTHVARNRLSDGFVPDNEPAWFREGLAEVISGLSLVKASGYRHRYSHFHIILLRKFANWTENCGSRLSRFRESFQLPSKCEYLYGAAGIELLIAKYGGIPKIVRLYEHMRESGDFLESFKYTYGMSLREFERRADIYAKYISQAANW